MSYFDGIGGKYNRVPGAQNARNQQLQHQNTLNGIIESAAWGKKEAAVGQAVPFTVTLNRLSLAKSAVIEILFNAPSVPALAVGTPIILPATDLVINGRWQAAAPRSGNPAAGHFTFRVRVDNQAMISNELVLVEDAVARMMRRNNSDGFDR